ncbi:MAG: GntR family transcriptional regulator [Planctomycetota bacterium]|nr:GntR family transcriptional regulator [Planctomycetota bacterium]
MTTTEPARIRAVATLRSWIEDGTLVAGSCLPSERALASQLEVSKPSVHRALQVLERDGLISPAVGRTRTVYGSVGSSLLAQTVVVLSSHKKAKHHASTGFSDHVAEGAHAAVSDAGWHSMAFHPDRADASGVRALLAQRPVGVLIPETREASLDIATRLRDAGVPVVVNIDGPAWVGFDRVASDHAAGGARLVELLAARERRRLGTVWNKGAQRGWWHAPRMAGMSAAAAAAGLAPVQLAMVASASPKQDPWADDTDTAAYLEQYGRNYLGQIIELLSGPEPCDGLMVHTDTDAVAVAMACRLFGLEPGRDIDVLGYDYYLPDLPYSADARGLLQASVDRDTHGQGEALVAVLQRRLIEGGDPGFIQHVQPRLITLS